MPSNVYFSKDADEESVRKLFLRALADLKQPLAGKDRVAVKVHFGEEGNTRFVSPKMIAPLLFELKKINNNHFLTDCNTLYRGSRLNSKDHVKIALEHGFGALDTEIIIADGNIGEDESAVEISKKIFRTARIGKAIADADAIILVSHFKGHMMLGFGGALKNLGMGCGSRAGKLAMHSKIMPSVNAKKCTGCGICAENCAENAIEIADGKAVIGSRCVGCAKCIAVCPNNAIRIPWAGASSEECQERCAEYAFAAAKGKKLLCINFAIGITKDCDCISDSKIIAQDAGVFASVDPVACDAACLDVLLKKNNGVDVFKKENGFDGRRIVEYSEEIGLGSRKYKLVEL